MVHVFGIRHHGPGSARTVRLALDELGPDIVLVEGPPDAQSVLPLLVHPAMKPPVALLVYASDAPSQAVFYPFAIFSPEWQALTYALERGIPARFMDLPLAHQLGDTAQETPSAPDEAVHDPLAALAAAAGYRDRELWWEQQIEQRADPRGVFEAILEAMRALRAGLPPHAGESAHAVREARREAHMRRTIRAAQREGFARIAVVCGAWHAPALEDPAGGDGEGRAARDEHDERAARDRRDEALLKKLPRTKTEATWVPWTSARLAYRSGYGAGIASPGWYAHLWRSGDRPGRASITWMAQIAGLLREADLDAPPASVIEAVRLAETLAALRELPIPGLAELSDAALSVLCQGAPAPMELIRTKLEVGEDLGEVPEESPAVPLQRDLAAAQRRLRLKPAAEPKPLELDLRGEHDRERSHLLHRLVLLDIPWGTPQQVSASKTGTFHEHWSLAWRPELTVALVEASIYGNTLESAATAKVSEQAEGASLPRLTASLDATILSDLPEATDRVLACVQERAALSADVLALMTAFPPLARATRYGSVRQTRSEHLVTIVDGLFERIAVGLVPACASLDDAAAVDMRGAIAHMDESVALLHHLGSAWTELLHDVLGREPIHGLVRGSACRILVERGSVDRNELERLARLALSPVAVPAQAAAWIEGLLRGSALLLLQHDGLWGALDAWLGGLRDEVFVEMLPLVRRGFSAFGPIERRRMGERVRQLRNPAPRAEATCDTDRDAARAALVHPVLSQILGVDLP
ncbi:DUF5682 family protein [Pendulispora albinea]|uniref:DUF5682 family protein n=1 Tax=Pendulispora albinea TaxID=2741071 RepID=A0ABZ2MCF7_9BACT